MADSGGAPSRLAAGKRLLGGVLAWAVWASPAWSEAPSPALTCLAFGSCNHQLRPQPLWGDILANRPQVFMWLGDNIYADTEDMAMMAKKYALQSHQEGYQRLTGACRAIGVWDDHDFGVNDGGKEYPKKAESQRQFMDFIQEPADSPRRRQEGVYTSYAFGPPGRRVKILLLDGRFHREDPGPDADTLGAAQWAWLERELANSDAQVHLIGSGIQVIAQEHRFETWGKFPKARARLFQVIAKTKAKGVILLSGDRHFAELSKLGDTPAKYPLYDLTSSGLTHSYEGEIREVNRFRVGGPYHDLNFGLITIDWNADPVAVTLQIRGQGNVLAFEHRLKISDLCPPPGK